MTIVIRPKWPAPDNIVAGTSTRKLENVAQLNFPAPLVLLKQVHGATVLNASMLKDASTEYAADAVFSSEIHKICAVQTADCLPILICDKEGKWTAAVHAGWKGICAGVIENTLNALPVLPENLYIWFGPSISKQKYEVGEDMRSQFSGQQDADAFETILNKPHKYLCDLSILAKNRLSLCGVGQQQIFSEHACTYSDPELFYSYRREGTQQGRLLSFIWQER